MLHNLMDYICTFENLHGAFDAARKGKRYRDDVLKFSQNVERNLFELRDELISGAYRVGLYREFYVRYPKPRLVMALEFRDRVVQHAVYRQLNPYLDKRFIFDSYACRVGKGQLKAAQRFQYWERQIMRKPNGREWYALKLDISKYFYRVDHEIILSLAEKICDDMRFIGLMDVIVNNPDVPFGLPEGMRADECPPEKRLYEVGMPIGNLSSQMIANMYLDELDKYAKHRLKIKRFARYMDDVGILNDDLHRIHDWKDAIGDFLHSNLRLTLNKKTSVQKMAAGVEFVGMIVTPSAIRMRKSTRTHIKRVMRHLSEMYRLGYYDMDDIVPKLNSYYGLMLHSNTYDLRRWIEENIVFCRSYQPPMEPLFMLDEPEPEWWEHMPVPA